MERVALGVTVSLVALGGALGVRAGLADRTAEPVGPTEVRNGALVSLSMDGLRVEVAQGRLEHLPVDPAAFTTLQFTPDGSELVYLARHGLVTALDVVTGSTRVLAECPDQCQPSLSPDGRTVAMESRDGLVLQDVGGGQPTPRASRDGPPAGRRTESAWPMWIDAAS